ncbi:MAG TPA: GFA family protein [Burkholderiales bacterium]|nr:GFA family protein [Burkholderiales bacterium]
MKVEGSCHCGAITFEAEIDAATVTLCHCTDCQKLTGTAFRTTVPAPVQTFVLRSGTPKTYIKRTAESGRPRIQAFCGDCGTPIYACAVQDPVTYGIRVGTLAQRKQLHPARQIWCRSALPWAKVEGLPQRETE